VYERAVTARLRRFKDRRWIGIMDRTSGYELFRIPLHLESPDPYLSRNLDLKRYIVDKECLLLQIVTSGGATGDKVVDGEAVLKEVPYAPAL